jgi:hypothetical protein
MDTLKFANVTIDIEHIERDGKLVTKLTFTRNLDTFMVWLKPGQVNEFCYLLRLNGGKGYQCLWADRRICVAVDHNRIQLTRREGRRDVVCEYAITKEEGKALIQALK